MTILTTLSDPSQPFISTIRKDSNTGWDFGLFIIFCLENNHLRNGDWLILDNASVHFSNSTIDSLLYLLDISGV